MAAAAVCAVGLIPASGLAESRKCRTVTLEIRKRKVTGVKNKTIRVAEGEAVQINWTTDEPVGLHLHGYDIEVTAEPGRTVSVTFQAHTAGRFPVSAHGFGHGTMIYLEVHPR
jgi:FtsP/CotA-like multicopper oxidase with cupredoxin domain